MKLQKLLEKRYVINSQTIREASCLVFEMACFFLLSLVIWIGLPALISGGRPSLSGDGGIYCPEWALISGVSQNVLAANSYARFYVAVCPTELWGMVVICLLCSLYVLPGALSLAKAVDPKIEKLYGNVIPVSFTFSKIVALLLTASMIFLEKKCMEFLLLYR